MLSQDIHLDGQDDPVLLFGTVESVWRLYNVYLANIQLQTANCSLYLSRKEARKTALLLLLFGLL